MERGSVDARVERGYEKHAWLFLFALGIVGVIIGLIGVFTGRPFEEPLVKSVTGMGWDELVAFSPRIATYISLWIRFSWIAALFFSILSIAIAWKSYRRGERWAWYAFWASPISSLAFTGIILSGGVSFWDSSGSIFYTLVALPFSMLGLLLPYRKFFPKVSATVRA